MGMWTFIFKKVTLKCYDPRKTTSSGTSENKGINAHFQHKIGMQLPQKDQWDLGGAGGHCLDVRITCNCHNPATSRLPPASDA